MHRSTEGDANIGRFRFTLTDQPGAAVRSTEPMPIERLAKQPTIDEALRKQLVDQFLYDHQAFQVAKRTGDAARRHLAAMKKATGELDVMVMGEREERRPTHILQRGVWDQKGDQVGAAFPAAILARTTDGEPTRLELARWLVDPDNPLTARVIVNHLWQIAFGDGLVRTPEDFGLQGEAPAHPDVLDWLSVEMIHSGWDLKHILRLILTSETYRQSSDASAESIERDPANRMLARGARYRLPSWMIRDAALRNSGLLNPMQGGPPVMPYQPAGVWEEIFMGRYSYDPSPGPAQYRRTVYAFWRRSSAPTFLFDSAQRRVCEVKTMRTNTPLHALTLLNDVGMLEAASTIAAGAIDAWPRHNDVDSRLADIFKRILSRDPQTVELDAMRETYTQSYDYYVTAPADARAFLTIGQSQPDGNELMEDKKAAETAAMMVVASMVMNLDEAITHE
ncbi:MAG TPA: hypothetical protein DDZ51_25395, partial [Planctomycetaceae bacterium]|nr:hypothetical protein [Planctomycetaceae bacterium]